MSVRRAAVAGRFYPEDATTLRAKLEDFLGDAAAVAASEPAAAPPKALIAPHAGLDFSGSVAATGYAQLAAVRGSIRQVVLLGPAHRVPLRGLGVPSVSAFETPLGEVPLDRGAIERVLELPQVQVNDEAHEREHSLELHLPFLQLALDDFTLLPLVVGATAAEDVAEVLDQQWGGPETLIVVSTDLSHFLDYDSARRLDAETSGFIERLELEQLSGERACGHHPLRGLLLAARKRGMRVSILDVRNSGDTAGTRREVVGYGSYALS